ncbi:RNA polymerase sigma factor SigZ [Photobacterium lucens]|uniref:RNA polymerase sigma factor SigZ n=1 Tax=Photobacterium lucens TaxID=2562949 RepID=UPI00136F46FF|nr:RNA polymerase sigma factor SigZ [Photobacterium lucens]MBP2699586.1 RNA polymerase sigma factor SigZ [Vibrio parahaemolyticus]MZG56889.1 RNA polymerase sigma factor SigZ [Photobacterium lucens]MZG81650.1 RNA polymerase sigma factor SigZ [Photobacterium lucens]
MNIEQIWSAYQSKLKGYLHNNIANPDDVDDLLQDILIKTHHKLPTLNDDSKIKSWLFQIARNTIIDFYRHQQVEKKHQDSQENSLWYEVQEDSILQQLSECMTPFINALPEAEAQLLTAIEINGMSQKDYAEQTGIKYSTLKSQVQKSRKSLHQLFNACCTFSVDSQGNLMDYHPKEQPPSCKCS